MVEFKNDSLDDIFRALANGTRREILNLLAQRPHYMSELIPQFEISLTAISGHVQALERAGLVRREVAGRNHVCSLNSDALNRPRQWAERLQDVEANQRRSRPRRSTE
jgi:DNA-binding transcriptional ArsR family regulator